MRALQFFGNSKNLRTLTNPSMPIRLNSHARYLASWVAFLCLFGFANSALAVDYTSSPALYTYTSTNVIIKSMVISLGSGGPGTIRFEVAKVDGTSFIGGVFEVREGSNTGTIKYQWSYDPGLYFTDSPTFTLDFTSGSKTYWITGQNNSTGIYCGPILITALAPAYIEMKSNGGLFVSDQTPYQGDSFDANFTVENTGGSSVYVENFVVALHYRSSGAHYLDLGIEGGYTIAAGGSRKYGPQYTTLSDIGQFTAIAKVKIGGSWINVPAESANTSNSLPIDVTVAPPAHFVMMNHGGLFVSSQTPKVTDPFDASFTVINDGGQAGTIDQMVVALHWADTKAHYRDLGTLNGPISLAPGESYHYGPLGFTLDTAGQFYAVAKVLVGGSWGQALECGVVGLPYYVAEDSSNCLPVNVRELTPADFEMKASGGLFVSSQTPLVGDTFDANFTVINNGEQAGTIEAFVVSLHRNDAGKTWFADLPIENGPVTLQPGQDHKYGPEGRSIVLNEAGDFIAVAKIKVNGLWGDPLECGISGVPYNPTLITSNCLSVVVSEPTPGTIVMKQGGGLFIKNDSGFFAVGDILDANFTIENTGDLPIELLDVVVGIHNMTTGTWVDMPHDTDITVVGHGTHKYGVKYLPLTEEGIFQAVAKIRTAADGWQDVVAPPPDTSNYRPFTVISGKILLIRPTGDQINVGPVTFSWEVVNTAVASGFELQLTTETDTGFLAPVWYAQNIGSAERSLVNGAGLVHGQFYLWRMRVLENGEWSPWTPASGFEYRETESIPPEEVIWRADHPRPMAEDPVDVATGGFFHSETDIALPGVGLGISFGRYYNSRNASYQGAMGFGWIHSYDMSVALVGSEVTVWYADGHKGVYTLRADGTTIPQYGGMPEKLTQNPDGSWKLLDRTQVEHLFDASGKLVGIRDRNGNMVQLVRTGNNITQIIAPGGRTMALAYDTANPTNRIIAATDPMGKTVTYSYNASGNLESVTDRRGQEFTRHYEYDPLHQIVRIIDARGNEEIENLYDSDRRVVEQFDAAGGQSTFTYNAGSTAVENALGDTIVYEYDANRRLTRTTDSLNKTNVFVYDTNNNRTRVTDELGHITQYTYDSLGNVLTETNALNQTNEVLYNFRNDPTQRKDADGNMTLFLYDSKGNLISSTDAAGNTTYNTYDPITGLLSSTKDRRGNTTTYEYNAQGDLITVTVPTTPPGVTRYEYDDNGRRTKTIDPNGNEWLTAYDFNGNVTEETDPLLFKTIKTYDQNGNVLTIRDKKENTTAFEYDAKNRRIKQIDPIVGVGAGVTEWAYDDGDNLLNTKDPTGKIIHQVWNAKAQLVRVWDDLGNRAEYTYDDHGNRKTIANALGQTTEFIYDELNRVIRTIDPLGGTTVTTYDSRGNRATVTDPNGLVTTFHYDVLNRLTEVIDAAGKSTYFGYDEEGNRISIEDPNGHERTRTYDAANRLIEETDANNASVNIGYDAGGNIISRTDRNATDETIIYDERNQPTTISFSTGEAFSFTYDANGNQKTATRDGLTTTFTYDALNRMTESEDGAGYHVKYTWDKAGRPMGVEYPAGQIVAYGYDGRGRLATVTDWAAHVWGQTFDAADRIQSLTHPNGFRTDYLWDAAGRLHEYRNVAPGGAYYSQEIYVLDPGGRRVEETRNREGTSTLSAFDESLTYDPADRLLTADGLAYSNDANGARLSETGGAEGRSFVWDGTGRLSSWTQGSSTISFRYDGRGNRVERTAAGSAEWNVLDLSGKLPRVLSKLTAGTGPAYVYGGRLLAAQDAGGWLYYLYDGRGNTIALTDASGALVTEYEYDDFGNQLAESVPMSNPFRFLGAYGIEREGEGLYFARERYYDSRAGRFLSEDPAAFNDSQPQTINRYPYALNNPISYADVDGRTAKRFMALLKQMYSRATDAQHSNLLGGGNSVSHSGGGSNGPNMGSVLSRIGQTLIGTAGSIDDVLDIGKALKAGGALKSAKKIWSAIKGVKNLSMGLNGFSAIGLGLSAIERTQTVVNGEGSAAGQFRAFQFDIVWDYALGLAAAPVDLALVAGGHATVSETAGKLASAALDPVALDHMTTQAVNKWQDEGTLQCAVDRNACGMNVLEHFTWVVGSALGY